MSWIDVHAAPAGLLLVMAALGGLFFYLRRAPAQAAPSDAALPPAAWHALALAGLLAALGLAVLARDMLCLTAPGCAEGAHWHAMDLAVQQWFAHHRPPAWLGPVAAFTHLGHVGWTAALSVAVLLWLLWRREGLRAGAWLLGTAGVGLWIRAIKGFVARPRPEAGWVSEGGYSFPSGHSAGTLVLYGMLAWLLAGGLPRHWRAAVWGVALALGLSIGASRVMLRVHFASDVLAGWLLGLAWLALVVCTAEWARARR